LIIRKNIEISITLLLAHSTFIIAEYFLGVSGILATVAAGIMIGNYGSYKISHSVKGLISTSDFANDFCDFACDACTYGYGLYFSTYD